MIIECINCNKKFEVNSELIPDSGRTIQCGSCNHTWFYKISENTSNLETIINSKKDLIKNQDHTSKKKKIAKKIDKVINSKDTALVKYQKKKIFTLSKFLSLIIVLLISFTGLILLLDTFKLQLFSVIPSLEFLLFSLFETLKDIQLFIKDLI